MAVKVRRLSAVPALLQVVRCSPFLAQRRWRKPRRLPWTVRGLRRSSAAQDHSGDREQFVTEAGIRLGLSDARYINQGGQPRKKRPKRT